MEALTRMVADSLARHGFDIPVDTRRLLWSRWFRCDSPHSLLVVPSKPGIFAIAEEVMDLGPGKDQARGNEFRPGSDLGDGEDTVAGKVHVGTAALGCPAERSSAPFSPGVAAGVANARILGGAALQRCDSELAKDAASAAEVRARRMLAVLQFCEDDDMAFTLDRMFTRPNPMRARFAAGRCFVRFVVIEDQTQRRSICSALNQWMLSSAERATGIESVARTFPSANPETALSPPKGQARFTNADTISLMPQAVPPTATKTFAQTVPEVPASNLDSGAGKNLHCPHPLPSGF